MAKLTLNNSAHLETKYMTIYVQSRGKAQDHDHCWLEVTKDHQISVAPPALETIKPEELIDSQKPSIILAQSGEFLILLVMALKAGDERLDFMGRQIRNSIAWVEKNDPGKEQYLRKITIRALNGKLVDDVDAAITSDADETYGFKANFDKLKAIGNSPDSPDVSSEEANLDVAKFGNNNKDLRGELISELTRYAIPISSNSIQIFVVETTLKSLDGLKTKGVWRGLSSRIDESEDWIEFDVSKNEKSRPKNSKKKARIGVITLIVVSLLALTTWFVANRPLHQDLQPESLAPVQQRKTNAIPAQNFTESLP